VGWADKLTGVPISLNEGRGESRAGCWKGRWHIILGELVVGPQRASRGWRAMAAEHFGSDCAGEG